MKKRTQIILLFIFAFLASSYIGFRLFERYFGGLFFVILESEHNGSSEMNANVPSCQFEEVQIDCPSFWGKEQSQLATVTISNPQKVEQEYQADVYSIILEQGDYHKELVCSTTLTAAPNQSESFTCEVAPSAAKGEIVYLQAKTSPGGGFCSGSERNCSTRPYYGLYCLIPFFVAIPFLGWLIRINTREEPDSDPGDA